MDFDRAKLDNLDYVIFDGDWFITLRSMLQVVSDGNRAFKGCSKLELPNDAS